MNRVDILMSLLVEEVVWHVLDSLLDSLHVGDLGVDLDTDVLISVSLSVWITMHFGCWS